MTKITAGSIWKQWVEETSFHGVKDIRDTEFKIVKICWVIVILGAAVIFAYQTYTLVETFIEDPIAVGITYDSYRKDMLEEQKFRIVYCPSDWIDVSKIQKIPELENKLFFAFLLSHLDSADLFQSFDTGVQFYHVDHWVRYLLGIKPLEKIRYEKFSKIFQNQTEEFLNFRSELKFFLQKYDFLNLTDFFFKISADHGGGADGNITAPENKILRYGRVCGVYPSDSGIDYLFTSDGRADLSRYFFHKSSNQAPGAVDVDIIISLNPAPNYRTKRGIEAGRPSDMLLKPFRLVFNTSGGAFTELSVDVRHEIRVNHSGLFCQPTEPEEKFHPGAYYRQCVLDCAEALVHKEPFCRMSEQCEDIYRPGLYPDKEYCPFWGPAYEKLFDL